MKQFPLTLALLVGVALLAAGPASATFGSAGKFEVVTMIFVDGESCVVVDKERATIYRNRKPKRVKWQVTVPGKYWELRYQPAGATDPGKSPGKGDFLSTSGTLDIPCDGSTVSTELPITLTPAKASWPYMIKVYECDGASKGEHLCDLDPSIDWGD